MTMVGEYELVMFGGLHFLTKDDRIVSTLVDMGEGTWRVRTPEGSARTIEVPDGTEHPAKYVAEQVAQAGDGERVEPPASPPPSP